MKINTLRYNLTIKSLLAIFFLSIFFSSFAIETKDLESITSRTITVKGDIYYPPFEFINDRGEPDGFNVELFQVIAEMLGLKYELTLGVWNEVRKELENGEIDMLLGVLISEERAKNIKFGIPHSVITHGIFTHKDKDYNTLLALKGKEVVVQEKDLMHDLLLKMRLTDNIITVPGQLEALTLIDAGEHDAALVGNYQGAHLLNEHKLTNVRIRSQKIKPYKYAMAVNADNDELLWLLNMALYQLKATGEYDKIYNKWFSVYERKDFFAENRNLFIFIGIALAALAIFVILLRVRVAYATKELKLAKERAEQNDKLKSSFLNNISHEIRTPLNGLIGFTNLISEKNTTEEMREYYASIIQQCTEQLTSIIDDIIIIATIEASQAKLNTVKTDINALMDDIYTNLKSSVPPDQIDFHYNTELSAGESLVYIDKEKLRVSLTKLINNAIFYTRRGEVVFGCKLEEDNLYFYVEDTGSGIPDEYQDVVFNHFRQIIAGKTQGYGANGLGLVITKSYVEMMGGKIWLNSIPGEGSKFMFTIPYKPTTVETLLSDESNIPEKSQELQSLKFLIAEDDFNNYTLAKIIIAQNFKNATILHAENGIDAIDIARCHKDLDLILMDLKMPEMSGYQAAKIIKKENPDISVIAITAYEWEYKDTETEKNIFDGFVVKPFKKHKLIFLIKKALINKKKQ